MSCPRRFAPPIDTRHIARHTLSGPRAASPRRRAHNRRIRCRADAGLTQAEWNHILDVFGNRCAYCGTEGKLTIDHFLPLALDGGHRASNIVPACGPCNSSKNDSDPFEWMAARGIDADFVVSVMCDTRLAA